MNLPKHIQEAATPLTDAAHKDCNQMYPQLKEIGDFVDAFRLKNLERIIIWQQELLKEGIQYVHIDGNKPAQEYLERFNRLQSYLKTMKGEK